MGELDTAARVLEKRAIPASGLQTPRPNENAIIHHNNPDAHEAVRPVSRPDAQCLALAPNQCNDQHGRGNAGPFCNFDPNDNGTQAGLNPALMQLGDVAAKRIVNSIKQSPVWKVGKNAIVVVCDENDYRVAPNTNNVLVIVDTNYGSHGVQSATAYNHFSLLKSIEGGLGLPCLNHACDTTVNVMSDLFGSSFNQAPQSRTVPAHALPSPMP